MWSAFDMKFPTKLICILQRVAPQIQTKCNTSSVRSTEAKLSETFTWVWTLNTEHSHVGHGVRSHHYLRLRRRWRDEKSAHFRLYVNFVVAMLSLPRRLQPFFVPGEMSVWFLVDVRYSQIQIMNNGMANDWEYTVTCFGCDSPKNMTDEIKLLCASTILVFELLVGWSSRSASDGTMQITEEEKIWTPEKWQVLSITSTRPTQHPTKSTEIN